MGENSKVFYVDSLELDIGLESEICEDNLAATCENETTTLYSGKRFLIWKVCENFLKKWAKKQVFHIIKDRVSHEDNIIRRWTFLCEYSRSYDSNSHKDTKTKKKKYTFLVNVSCLKVKNLEDAEILDEDDLAISIQDHEADSLQVVLKEMFKFVGVSNIKEIWAISIGNSLKAKHYIIFLLQEFVDNIDESDSESEDEQNNNDKENINPIVSLKNLKAWRGKGWPTDTNWFKSVHKAPKLKVN
ncbi:12745_t:CDS:2 [Racocetra fulgida]|uniref:12745_t:CDS:1 n=1 Tax=Racocetra fulgida TaxID=60492 RepID=A0A9N9FY03_9GLOM|nr:12745_t:CDS:2 [Racocetra fulgida]